jgi:methylamine dehydrogenase accessory protein MauD
VGVQSILILGLMREVGLIQLRIGPMSAMSDSEQGVPVGATAPTLEGADTLGRRVVIGAERARAQLLVFLSPSCGVCHSLVGPLGILGKSERDIVDVVAVCSATSDECAEFLKPVAKWIEILIDDDRAIKEAFNVTGSSFGLVVDRLGRAGQSGIVNNLQQLESLLSSVTPEGDVLVADYQDDALVERDRAQDAEELEAVT